MACLRESILSLMAGFTSGRRPNSVNEQVLDVKRSQVFVNELEYREEILNMPYKEREKMD
ncbi:hypothetical protein JCM10550A_12630 [Methanogenium cariaci]